MSERRDQQIDRLLRRGAAAPPLSPSAECLDGEALGAWMSRTLAAHESARIEAHVADCGRCQQVLALMARTTPSAPGPQAPWWRSQVGWLVPLATAAVVVAVWIAAPERQRPLPDPAQSAGSETSAPREQGAAAYPAGPAAELGTAPPRVAPPSQARERSVAPGSSAGAQPVAGLVAPPASTPPPLAAKSEAAPAAASDPARAPAPVLPAPLAESVVVSSDSAAMRGNVVRTPLADIVSPDRQLRWRIVGGRQLHRSTDGGASWQASGLASTALLTAGHAPAANVLWVVGEGGTIYVTSDGVSFAPVPFVQPVNLRSVTAVDGRQASVTAADGTVWHTIDRGATWTRPR